jgi:hypothetical protein
VEALTNVGDVLFEHLESLHMGRAWSSVLDAGTGRHSLTWVRSLPTQRWTAVTADPDMEHTVREMCGSAMRSGDRIVRGDWTDPSLLAGERFDVVLADYLLGAIDGFAPYFQHKLFERLAPLVGERLYVIGLEPWTDRPDTDETRVITEITRLRDAVLLLCRERPYREFPSAWLRDHLLRAGFSVVSERRFANVLGHGWIDRQLEMCARRLARLPSDAIGDAMAAYIRDLRERAHTVCNARGGLRGGHDHVFAAEPTRRKHAT